MHRFRALVLLGWHFLVHWLRKVTFRYDRGGVARFRANYDGEGLAPLTAEQRLQLPLWQGCVGCGLCDLNCVGATADGPAHNVSLQLLMSAGSRDLSAWKVSSAEAQRALEDCPTCRACEAVCPTQVPIVEVLQTLAATPR